MGRDWRVHGKGLALGSYGRLKGLVDYGRKGLVDFGRAMHRRIKLV